MNKIIDAGKSAAKIWHILPFIGILTLLKSSGQPALRVTSVTLASSLLVIMSLERVFKTEF